MREFRMITRALVLAWKAQGLWYVGERIIRPPLLIPWAERRRRNAHSRYTPEHGVTKHENRGGQVFAPPQLLAPTSQDIPNRGRRIKPICRQRIRIPELGLWRSPREGLWRRNKRNWQDGLAARPGFSPSPNRPALLVNGGFLGLREPETTEGAYLPMAHANCPEQ